MQRPLRPLFRLFGGVAAVVVVTFIAVNAGPIIRDEVVRKETARRVKEKVGEVVESAVGTVQEIQGRTEEARGIVRSTAEAAVDAGKKAAREAAAKLEVPEVRRAREEAERKAARPWWAFWSRR